MRQKTFVSLTNIPTPYRVHFYNQLNKVFSNRNITLSVWFMANTEPGRYWNIEPDQFKFPYRFLPGIHPQYKSLVFHFNPNSMPYFVYTSPDWLLLSGSWFFPTVQLAAFMARISHTKTLFWNESNLAYVERTSKLVSYWRGTIMNMSDAFVVPGKWAQEYVFHFTPKTVTKPVLQLPNVIDERLFRDKVADLRRSRDDLRQKWQIEFERSPVLLTVARLEPIKGIEQLVQAFLTTPDLGDAVLLIAGTGALKEKIEKLIESAIFTDRVRLLGQLPESAILELLALSDGLVLPSFGDPYPLAVVEAAFAGLPLLISNRVGCHPEALVPGKNGFLFDPENQYSIQNCLRLFCQMDQNAWIEMGKESIKLASERFESNLVINRFVDELMEI